MENKSLKILYDHWLVIFGSIIVTGLSASVIAKYWNLLKELTLQIISHSATGWILLLLLIVIFGIKKLTKKKQPCRMISLPPPYKKKDLGKHKLFGVVWNVWIGFYSLFYESQKKLWADGPFCPDCLYELDRDYKRNEWICIKCNQSFNIPKNIRENTTERVIKIFEAELRK